MSLERSAGPDWRDAGFYAPLLKLERSGFAWEWLRRDPHYRRDAAQARPGAKGDDIGFEDLRAARWGLHAFEHPDRAAPEARPLWRRKVHPFVLSARAVGGGAAEDRFDLRAFTGLWTMVLGDGGAQHLLISDGIRSVRLDLMSGPLLSGPVTLDYVIGGFASAEPPVLVLRRLLALVRTGRFGRGLHPPDVRAARRVLLLRANDALAAGASQRELAEHLLGLEAGAKRWRIAAPTLRSSVQRLARGARLLAKGGYLELLK